MNFHDDFHLLLHVNLILWSPMVIWDFFLEGLQRKALILVYSLKSDTVSQALWWIWHIFFLHNYLKPCLMHRPDRNTYQNISAKKHVIGQRLVGMFVKSGCNELISSHSAELENKPSLLFQQKRMKTVKELMDGDGTFLYTEETARRPRLLSLARKSASLLRQRWLYQLTRRYCALAGQRSHVPTPSTVCW